MEDAAFFSSYAFVFDICGVCPSLCDKEIEERKMDLSLSTKDTAFRDQVRRFLDEKLTPELRATSELMTSVYAD